MKKANKNSEERAYSIGDVAKVTGISVFTLRMWERRYGLPESIKLPSGHRRYNGQEVARLKLVKNLNESGHKAAHVLQLSTDELKELVGQTSCQNSSGQKYSFAVQSILEMGRAWDDQAIYQQFELDWSALGPIGFISERASNLLDQLGQGWANGQISIATEHFISRILEKFLIEKWTLKNAKNGNRKLLLSSLDGEGHAFGLHFCAVATVVSGAKVVFLGPSTPEADIVSAAQSSECFGVCLSVSRHYDSNLAVKKIRYIRKHLPPTIHLIVGGAGAPVGIQGVLAMTGCQALYDWLSSEKGSP